MEEMLYTALDLAAIISSLDLGCQGQSALLDKIWENERSFLLGLYRNNRRQLILDTSYWLTYFSDKPAIDQEFPSIQKDAVATGETLFAENYTVESSNLDLFLSTYHTGD